MIVYRTFYLKNVARVANPTFNKGNVHALLVMGFVDCLLCDVRNNANPTYIFLYSLSCGNVEVITVLQKHCLIYATCCVRMLEVFDFYEKRVSLWMKYIC